MYALVQQTVSLLAAYFTRIRRRYEGFALAQSSNAEVEHYQQGLFCNSNLCTTIDCWCLLRRQVDAVCLFLLCLATRLLCGKLLMFPEIRVIEMLCANLMFDL